MTTAEGAPSSQLGLAAFALSLVACVPFTAMMALSIFLSVTSLETELSNPGTPNMISSNFLDYLPWTLCGFTLTIPLAGLSIGLALWSRARAKRLRKLAIAALIVAGTVLVLGVLGIVLN